MVPPRIISQHAKLSAYAHEFGVHEFYFGREDVVVQPIHQRKIVCDAAKQRHCSMRMTIDQSWHDDSVFGGQRAFRAVLSVDIVGASDGDNQSIINRYGAITNHGSVCIHGDYVLARE